MSDEIAKAKGSRATLWILIAVCIAPIAASYVAFYWWQPSEQVNYGELLAPRPLPDVALARPDGDPFRLQALRGKWVLTVVDSGRCDAWCEEKLTYIRQIRLAQGKDADRIERLWVITDEVRPQPSLLAAHEGLHVLHAGKSELPAHLPARHTREDHIYVIDPLGNLMMRYPRHADPRKMLKDVTRLLRHSKWR
jgi:cytochrome oxidase Cu insertion factor (SCO1/SenC/PrrC family)